MSRTQKALAWLDANAGKEGVNPHAAAKKFHLTSGAVYNALRRRDGKKLCPTCGQVVREGFSIRRTKAE
jgi:hypothetical protein